MPLQHVGTAREHCADQLRSLVSAKHWWGNGSGRKVEEKNTKLLFSAVTLAGFAIASTQRWLSLRAVEGFPIAQPSTTGQNSVMTLHARCVVTSFGPSRHRPAAGCRN